LFFARIFTLVVFGRYGALARRPVNVVVSGRLGLGVLRLARR
jgi:hypothetical protein